ncbi:MAG: DUF4358 domain-containing protein [Culicoidibacterales bacterium]
MKKFISICACALFAIGLTACGGSSDDATTGETSFTTVQTAVKDAIVTFLEDGGVNPAEENGQISGYATYDILVDDISALYPTINPEDFASGTIYMPMMMTKSDLIIVAEATNADAVANIEASFEGVKEGQIQQWQQYLPDQFEKVEVNQVVTSGNYVLYSTFDNNDVVDAFKAATK